MNLTKVDDQFDLNWLSVRLILWPQSCFYVPFVNSLRLTLYHLGLCSPLTSFKSAQSSHLFSSLVRFCLSKWINLFLPYSLSLFSTFLLNLCAHVCFLLKEVNSLFIYFFFPQHDKESSMNIGANGGEGLWCTLKRKTGRNKKSKK